MFIIIKNGGWGGIRTHGMLSHTPVFKTGTFNRSVTHPRGSVIFYQIPSVLAIKLWKIIYSHL